MPDLPASTHPNPESLAVDTEKPLSDIQTLWKFSDPEESKRRFRQLLADAHRRGTLSFQLEVETQIARAQGLQQHFDQCHATLDSVQRRLAPELVVANIRYLLERGRAFRSGGQPSKAEPLFQDAWQRSLAAKEYNFAIDAAHMVAIANPDPAMKIEWNKKAIDLANAHVGQQRWLPSLYNNLGEAYRAAKNYAEALACFRKCAEFDREAGRPSDIYTTKDIAKMLRLLGHAAAAIALIEPIALHLKQAHTPDGYISAEYGESLLAVGSTAEAQPWLNEAYELLSQDSYIISEEPEVLIHLKSLVQSK